MLNPFILKAVTAAWSDAAGKPLRALDLSCGDGATSRMLAGQGFKVVATDYSIPRFAGDSIGRVGGVDLNRGLPFKDATFDAVNLVEVIEHIENQAQLIREITRLLKRGGSVVISTPNILNAFSRLRFVFTGFLRGRTRPLHYSFKPGRAHNIYLIHFYELYYLLFHSNFEIERLITTRTKLAPLLFGVVLFPLMWLFSVFAVILAEKDMTQRRMNWEILRFFFSPPLLFSDNIVVKARIKKTAPKHYEALVNAEAGQRGRLYKEAYERYYERPHVQARVPNARRRRRVEAFRKILASREASVLELGCGFGDLARRVAVQGQTVVGSDISLSALQTANQRSLQDEVANPSARHLTFVQMNAIELALHKGSFDYVVSTSMIEHLHPDDVQSHLREVHRVLKPNGAYLIWCPNGLGHHGDRDFHLTMFSYRDLMRVLEQAGFRRFQSLMFNRYPYYVDSKWKVVLEESLVRWKIGILWSHLGVRNILMLASK
jgi:2-polyprenyl-3-methyl-5-hydroxy-6-metoxy-1,4-benzoquinol methylase